VRPLIVSFSNFYLLGSFGKKALPKEARVPGTTKAVSMKINPYPIQALVYSIDPTNFISPKEL